MNTSGTTKKKYMAPVIRFMRKQIEVGQDGTATKISVSEFVKAGQCLADFPEFSKYAQKGFEKKSAAGRK